MPASVEGPTTGDDRAILEGYLAGQRATVLPARAGQEVPALREEWKLGDAAVATVPFAHEIDFRGDAMSVRMVYVHLIGEYARHNGHADLLRQAIDGVTGR